MCVCAAISANLYLQPQSNSLLSETWALMHQKPHRTLSLHTAELLRKSHWLRSCESFQRQNCYYSKDHLHSQAHSVTHHQVRNQTGHVIIHIRSSLFFSLSHAHVHTSSCCITFTLFGWWKAGIILWLSEHSLHHHTAVTRNRT